MLLRLQLPDLLSGLPFELRISPHCRTAARASDAWLMSGLPLTDRERLDLYARKAGLLATMLLPTADSAQLRVCCDFLNLLFYFRDHTRELSPSAVEEMADRVMGALYNFEEPTTDKLVLLVRGLWSRLLKTCPDPVAQRLLSSLSEYFSALVQRAADNTSRTVPDLESYIALRRLTSGCAFVFLLIEYAHGMRLPSEIQADPAIIALEYAAMDLIAWSNDIYSYNAEQARGESSNLVTVLMEERGLSAQNALHDSSELFHRTLDMFIHDVQRLSARYSPSRSSGSFFSGSPPRAGKQGDIATYVRGLGDCIAGTLNWSFETERYFGEEAERMRTKRVVPLLPRIRVGTPPRSLGSSSLRGHTSCIQQTLSALYC